MEEQPKNATLNFQAPSTELANQAVERLTRLINIGRPDAAIDINIEMCTEGSRWGRICCGELGMGWIVLNLTWQLQGNPEPARRIKLRDSGAIGFTDVCEPNYGENLLLNDMTVRAARKITKEALELLQTTK